MSNTKRSLFAESLEGLLRAPANMTNDRWAEILGVPAAEISLWLNDEDAPMPNQIHRIILVLRDMDGIPDAPLKQFSEMAALSSRLVSPHSRMMHPSVGHYMLIESRRNISNMLAALSFEVQEKVLHEFHSIIRAAKG